jgi:hypothetical protein
MFYKLVLLIEGEKLFEQIWHHFSTFLKTSSFNCPGHKEIARRDRSKLPLIHGHENTETQSKQMVSKNCTGLVRLTISIRPAAPMFIEHVLVSWRRPIKI